MVARQRASATNRRPRPATEPEAAPRTRRQRPAQTEEAPARTRRTRAAAPAAKQGRDLSQYEDYQPTPYHKAFATWLVKEVGYRPSGAASTKEAFLQGVALATATRPAFNDSEYLEAWYKETGQVKRGRKPASEAAPEPEPEDYDDDEIDEDDDSDFDDESDDDDSDFDDDDDEPEEAPAPAPRRGRPAKAAPAKAAGRRAAPAKAAPAKAQRPAANRRAKADDDFVF